MPTRNVWDINDGFETFPPSTTEHLYLEVEAPDFVVSHFLSYANKTSELRSIGVDLSDLHDYVDGQYVFAIHFTMKKDFSDSPTKSIKINTTAYLNSVSGNIFHILAFADSNKKKYARKLTPISNNN